ncbi:MAG: 50S ribosomal protein L24 [Candidatus Omnitrophota bacterium]
MSLLKKSDIVSVISGKDRGKKGKIINVLPRRGTILVQGINMVRKHVRRRNVQDQQAGIVGMEKPIQLSKVQYFCGRCNRSVRLGVKIASDGTHVRICRRCKEEI